MSRVLAYATARAEAIDRRRFLIRLAMASTALVVAPIRFLTRPVSAQTAICGPLPGCTDGYSAFCCTINRGINACPPGHFMGGWWRATGSSYCSSGSRYYIDCHPRCSCSCGSGNFCSSSCWSCSCGCPDTETCDQRHACCAVFRYGQCNTQIGCSGPVTCRVVTCTPPYQLFDSCGTTLLSDSATANQTAPCLAGPA